MDVYLKYMDFYYNSIAALPRLFQSPFRVKELYYHPRKTQFARMRFETFNVSFIFRGTGQYKLGPHSCRVTAPFVVTQWPGPLHEYGADGDWEEFAYACTPSVMAVLEKSGLIDPAHPFWPMQNSLFIRQQSDHIHELMKRGHQPGVADEIDRLCEFILFKSRVGIRTDKKEDAGAKKIKVIREYLAGNYHRTINLKTVCREHGISAISLHRYWKKYLGGSPGDYMGHLRLQEAARLLAMSGLTIGEIARQVGFEDPLYFSRRFRKTYGLSARDFRKRNASIPEQS